MSTLGGRKVSKGEADNQPVPRNIEGAHHLLSHSHQNYTKSNLDSIVGKSQHTDILHTTQTKHPTHISYDISPAPKIQG